jgi:very-short-patch-repair endonuclease
MGSGTLFPNPSPARGEGLFCDRATQSSSPLAGEEGARAEGVGRRGGEGDYLPLAKGMRRKPTDAERKLWSIVRGKRLGGWKFKRQEQIGDYIADFVCFGAKLIVEADGSQHTESTDDAARDIYLHTQGFRVLRFWNNDILTNSDGVAMAILAALETPLPNPSPARGEGPKGALNG